MLDFAKNTNQNLSGLLKLLKEGGVDTETFRDYVEVGVVWRRVVRKRFGSQAQPTEAEIDRALTTASTEGGISVLLTEIVLPAGPSQLEESRKISKELTKITNTKFIIVTHHALTMSKMNRLYGVTMPEKGISQLVAVDLQKAESMVA